MTLQEELDAVYARIQQSDEPIFTFTQSELSAFYHRAQMEMMLLMGSSPSHKQH